METTPPRISVVIASVNGPVCLHDCLASLVNQEGGIPAEIIVADCCGQPVREMVERDFPGVDFTQFAERRTIPELRAFGMLKSRGDVVAITEDHCVAPPDWFAQILKAHEGPYAAVGGAVENAETGRLVDWAVFFCEYLRFMNPIPEREIWDIPGNNAAYKRAALDEMRDLLEGGYWEGFWHQRLAERGLRLLSTPKIVIYHKKSFGFGEFLSQRYHYGRSYAGMRNRTSTPAKRLFYIVFSLALPPLLIWRMFQQVRMKGRFVGEFIRALPILAIFTWFWSIGEFVGYCFGPGDSLRKVE